MGRRERKRTHLTHGTHKTHGTRLKSRCHCLRIAPSLVHVTSNRVPYRTAFFAIGAVVLCALLGQARLSILAA